MAITDYNTSASLNTTLGGIFIGEGMARADVNGGIRQIMADIAVLPSGGGAALVKNALPSGSGLRDQPISDFINGNVLQPSQFTGTDEARFVAAITEANRTVGGVLGQSVQLPRGSIVVTTTFNIGNRADIVGVNKRGSLITADATHAGPYMMTVDNGGISTFDNALNHLTLNCNDVAGLGGVLSSAWQEGGGLRNVLIWKFRTYGVRFQDGDGGASTCLIDQSEIMGSGVGGGATAGVRVDQISLVGNFLLMISNTTITGDPSGTLDRGVDVVNDSLHCQAVHFEECDTAIYIDGVGSHVLIGVTGANTVGTLVEIAATFTGSLEMIGCFRGGATNFIKDNRSGGFGTITGYDPSRFFIHREPVLGALASVAGGSFDGTAAPAVPVLTNVSGVSSIVRNSTGTYTITLSRGGASASNFYVTANANYAGGSVRVELTGVSTFKLYLYDSAGSLVDNSTICFDAKRVK